MKQAPDEARKVRSFRRLSVLLVVLAVAAIAMGFVLGSGTIRGGWAWAIFLGWTAGFLVWVALAVRFKRSMSASEEKAPTWP